MIGILSDYIIVWLVCWQVDQYFVFMSWLIS